jgi:hypothetical protein
MTGFLLGAIGVAAKPEPVERQTIANSTILRKFFFKVSSSRVWHSDFLARALIPNKPDCFW